MNYGASIRKGAFVNPRFMLAVAALVLLGAACSSSKPAAAAKEEAAKTAKGSKPAPEFALQDANGQTVKLSDFKGKVVLLDFWATWCGPCKIEIPWFIEFQRKYKDQGFTVIGVSLDEDGWKAVKPFIEQSKMNYPVLIGSDELASKFGGVDVLPTTFVIDKQGQIIATHQGLTSKDEFEDAIKSHL
jgi:cytochrome c biogenesis protein CcmG/thiol:disulfide interchange protein DsbE